MSSAYNRVGMGLSISDIPILGAAIDWADAKVKQAVEYIITKYAEFERVTMNAPAQVADAERLLSVLRSTDATPQQLVNAERYVALARQAQAEANKRGAVDQVVAWARQVSQARGLGALPVLVPLWVAGTAAVAVYAISSAIKSYNEANIVRSALQAGLSPEQIAKLGSRGSIGDALSSVTSGVGLIALGVGGLLLFNFVKGGRR